MNEYGKKLNGENNMKCICGKKLSRVDYPIGDDSLYHDEDVTMDYLSDEDPGWLVPKPGARPAACNGQDE